MMGKENTLKVEKFEYETLVKLNEEFVFLHERTKDQPKLSRDIEEVWELVYNEIVSRDFDPGEYYFCQGGSDYNMSDQEIEDAFINQYTDIGGPEDEEKLQEKEAAPKPTMWEMLKAVREHRMEEEAQRIEKILNTGFSKIQFKGADEEADPKEIIYRFDAIYEGEPVEIVGYIDDLRDLQVFCRVKILNNADWINITSSLI